MQPLAADVTGDGSADIIALTRGDTGDVYVHTSSLSSTNALTWNPGKKWSDWFCARDELCATGDFNADYRWDLLALTMNADHDAWVGLTSGARGSEYLGAPVRWHDSFGSTGENAAVGQFSDAPDDNSSLGGSDVVLFTRNNVVYTAASNGTQFVDAAREAVSFCGPNEFCTTANVNGDKYDDLVFVRLLHGSSTRRPTWTLLRDQLRAAHLDGGGAT